MAKGINDYNYSLHDFITSKIDNDKTKKHIDIGCGDKNLCRILRKDLWVFYKGIEKGDNWNGKNIAYDFAYMLDVIEHLNEKTLNYYLKKVSNCLKQDGVLIISTPHINNLYQLISFWGEPEHKRPYTKESIKALCAKYALFINRQYKFHYFKNPLKILVNILLGLDNWNKDIYFIKKSRR